MPLNTYNAINTFMRCDSELVGKPDVVISGIPFDLATTYRPGARFGPAAIRTASAQLGRRKLFPWGFTPLERIQVVDRGDLQLDAHNPLNISNAIVEHAQNILYEGCKMLSFGGSLCDLSVAYCSRRVL
ncbi:MAG: arginase family protein [Acidithiobacillus sp.]